MDSTTKRRGCVLGELLANGETEACAAEASRYGGVDLLERLEQVGEVRLRNADSGIGHRNFDVDLARSMAMLPDVHNYFTLVSKLHRIVEDVDDDLLNSTGIALFFF